MISDPEVDLACRLDYRARTLPADASCATCGADWVGVLFRSGDAITCYGCDRVRRGLPATEDHHVGGKCSRVIVRIPANIHRYLTAVQEATWRGKSPSGSAVAFWTDLTALVVVIAAAEMGDV
jgi:hypothetical protein